MEFLKTVKKKLNETKGNILRYYKQVAVDVEKIDLIDQFTANFNKYLDYFNEYFDEKFEYYLSSDQEWCVERIQKDFGNDVVAHRSVLTALLVFLTAITTSRVSALEEINKSLVLRCIYRSIILGGDTDTIASMAASLAGAYCGFSEDEFPSHLVMICESPDSIENLLLKL
ncbi:ADP-ribose glycohydrolase ARH3 [Cichlidogyrus casuarinus]|uniref:ADP-ribose glycohydrolase ARH3 n=1 Tax=Cichlidogyrus casuarinus TaxID=1844966 RepID=A0ABD2Q642_9PLAT